MIVHIYMEASLGSVDASLNKSWPPGVRRGQNGRPKFYIEIYRKILKKKNLLLKNDKAIIHHIYMEACSGSVDSNLFKSWPPGVERGQNVWPKFLKIYTGKFFKNHFLKNSKSMIGHGTTFGFKLYNKKPFSTFSYP